MLAASAPHLLDAFATDVCWHIRLHGWWFAPASACLLAATCKQLRRDLEPSMWSCGTAARARLLFGYMLQRAQLTRKTELFVYVFFFCARLLFGMAQHAQLANRTDFMQKITNAIFNIGWHLEQARDRSLALRTCDELRHATGWPIDNPKEWASLYFDWLRDFFGCEVGPHPKSVPRAGPAPANQAISSNEFNRRVRPSEALLAFARVLIAFQGPWHFGHGMHVCHAIEHTVCELVKIRRLRRLVDGGAKGP